MSRKIIALLVVLVVLGSGCLGGGKNTSTTPTTTPIQNFSVSAPGEVVTKGFTLSFTVMITGVSGVSNIDALLQFGGKTLNLDVRNVESIGNGYKAVLSYTFPPGTRAENTTATLKVIVHTDNGRTFSKSIPIKLSIRPPVPKVSVSTFTWNGQLNVSKLTAEPLTVVLNIKADTNGVLVVTNVYDSKGFVVGLNSPLTFRFKNESVLYQFNVTYNVSKVISTGGGADRITVEGYYYSYLNPSEKIKFKSSFYVIFNVVSPQIDFSAFNGLTVLGAGYLYNKSVDYALVEVTFVAPTGLARAVEYGFSVSTDGLTGGFKGLGSELVAVNGYVNVTKAFSVFREHEATQEAVITVPANDTVVTLLIKAKKMNLNSTTVSELVKSKFYIVANVLKAETEDGKWVKPDEPVSFKQDVTISGVVDVSSSGCCPFNVSGVITGFAGLYTAPNPERVIEGVLFVAYPYILNKEQTVRVTVSSKNLKLFVSETPLTLPGFISLLHLNSTAENGTVYLTFGAQTLHKLYVYAVPNGAVSLNNISVNVTVSTQGTNGQIKSFEATYKGFPEFRTAFVYLEDTAPAVELVKSAGGFILTMFDTPYLSWYAGANVLFNYGVPVNVSKTFYIPVTFVSDGYGDYELKAVPVSNESVKLKPLAVLNGGAVAYYGLVKVTLKNPLGFYPVLFIVTEDGRVVNKEKTYINSMTLAFMNQIDLTKKENTVLYASSLLDTFINDAGYIYFLSSIENATKEKLSKGEVYVKNGTLYAFEDYKPLYAFELGYFTFKFGKGRATLEFERGFQNVSTYGDFQRVLLTEEGSWDRIFGINDLLNPANLSYVKLNPGDERRLVSIAFFLPVDRNKKVSEFSEVLIEGGKLHYITVHPDGSVSDETTSPEFPGRADAGYYLAVPDKKRYTVGGYEFVNTSENFPFYEVKVIYVPDGGEYDLNKVTVRVNGEDVKPVWDKGNITKVLMNYYSFLKNSTPAVIVKPYLNFLVFDIYSPPDEPINSVEILYGGKVVYKQSIGTEEAKYLTFLNYFDAGLLPDFGFYTFDFFSSPTLAVQGGDTVNNPTKAQSI